MDLRVPNLLRADRQGRAGLRPAGARVAWEEALTCSVHSRSGGEGAYAWTLRRLDERALGDVVGGAEYEGHEDAICHAIGLGLHKCSECAAKS